MQEHASRVGDPQLSRPHWVTFLTLASDEFGQIPARYVPFLATGDLGPLQHSLSAILYPTGMREAMIRSLPIQMDLRLSGPKELPFWSSNHVRVWNDIKNWQGLELRRQANVIALLNCLSEQRVAVRLIEELKPSLADDAEGGWLLFEAARSLIRMHPENRSARVVLDRLRATSPDALLRALSGIHLAAMTTRVDRDHGSAESVLAEVRLEAIPHGDDQSFGARIAASRWHRLMALICTRKRDFRAVQSNIDSASDLAAQATGIVQELGGHEYVGLVAKENEKMVLESRVLAAGKQQSSTLLHQTALSLVELDPFDSYTWRTVAMACNDANMKLACLAALTGVCVLGGPGVPDLAAKGQAMDIVDDVEDEALADALLAAVARVY